MFKKIGWFIVFFLVIKFVLYSCCKEKTYNVDLQHIKIVYDNNEVQTVTSEDLIVYLDFVYNYDEVASILNSNFNFNTALATTCPNDIYNYNFSFTDLNITADADINGIEAGLSLNSIMKFSYNNIDDLASKIKFYSKNDKLRKRIAKKGKAKYFKLFDGNKIAKYIIDVSLGNKTNLFFVKIIRALGFGQRARSQCADQVNCKRLPGDRPFALRPDCLVPQKFPPVVA